MLIMDLFNDDRRMEQIGEDIYRTSDNDIVMTKIHLGDFTTESLANYICEVEDAYDEYHTCINLYIAMDPTGDVLVEERDIKSHADFTIKLAVLDGNPVEIALQKIGAKIVDGTYTQEDIDVLQTLPMMCKREDRKECRKKVLDLLEMVG
jgi:hypothetical protein